VVSAYPISPCCCTVARIEGHGRQHRIKTAPLTDLGAVGEFAVAISRRELHTIEHAYCARLLAQILDLRARQDRAELTIHITNASHKGFRC